MTIIFSFLAGMFFTLAIYRFANKEYVLAIADCWLSIFYLLIVYATFLL